MDIDALSHSPELHNKILQELYIKGLCQYINLCKAYILEKSNCKVNCSYVLIFLRQSTCYVITPHTHQWFKINANEILKNHKLAICDDQLAHIIPLPPAELPEINTFTTIIKINIITGPKLTI